MSNSINTDDINIEDLDNLEVKDQEGSTVAKIGLIITLYAKDTHTYEKKSALIECLQSYLKLTKNELKLHFFEGGHVKKFDPEKLPDFESKKLKFKEDTAFGYDATGANDKTEASSFSLSSQFNADYDIQDAGYITASFPINFVLEQKPGFLRDLCLNWAIKIQAHHGYAGFGLLRSIISGYAQQSGVLVYPLAKRFPGLEIDSPLSLSVHCRNKIKGVNWLTVLSNELVEELGGEDSIKEKLKETKNLIHHWKGGLALQAGPHPQLGDLEQNYVPKEYQQIYKVVKKVQVDYPWTLIKTPLDVDPKEFTKTWFTRFE